MYCPHNEFRATGRAATLPRGSDRHTVNRRRRFMLMEEMRTSVRRDVLRAVEPMQWLPILSRPPPVNPDANSSRSLVVPAVPQRTEKGDRCW
jgi:hypothetical protein